MEDSGFDSDAKVTLNGTTFKVIDLKGNKKTPKQFVNNF